ncbi:MAG: hypothetical protein WCD86_13910 [Ktedonobacteraceae bacterium]|nr:hypothetical protein [Ktedonobacteraceae bacterium]
MNRRIAHRPRYRNTHHLSQIPPLRIRRDFSPRRWSYRNLKLAYPQPALGQGLLQIPFYRLAHLLKM